MKFESNPIEEHDEAPLADDGRWENIVAHWSQRQEMSQRVAGKNACYVACVGDFRDDVSRDAQLGEILGLVRAQGDDIVGHEVYKLRRVHPKTFIGGGACRAIAERAVAHGADMLVIDAELSPSQMRNMEEIAALPICDREAVILNVFSRHAKSRKAKIQVEIAHLEYLRPRIRGLGLVMDQQAGGAVRARGPGETASELLARRLDDRLLELQKAFARLKRSARVQRAGRDDCQRIALVGYTNAGKTTLMNGLSEAGLSAKDMPFETLDTTSRCLSRHGGDVLLTDTVGFIRRLPDRLFESFASTLAEVREASLLALVVDLSDPEWRLHLQTTTDILSRLEADGIPRFYIFNKLDRVVSRPTDETLREAASGYENMVLSGHDRAGLSELKHRLIEAARGGERQVVLHVPYSASAITVEIYKRCRIVRAEPDEAGMGFTLEAPAAVLAQLTRALKDLQS